MRLTATMVKGLRTPGTYSDGDGLCVVVKAPERRTWVLRYMLRGRARPMGLGRVEDVTLAEARDLAAEARKLLRQGVDPIEHRRAAPAAGSEDTTFAEAAARYIAAHEAGWKNAKHGAQWAATLRTYVPVKVAKLPVGAITTDHVLQILEPIWSTKSETASRLRGRLEMILAYATARGWRAGPNPALWRGHLQLMLPARNKVRKVEHHAALDWREAGPFMARLAEQKGMGALALRFATLTAARSGEVRGATWAEIDLEAATWTIPAPRMKGSRIHRVPLSPAALALLKEVAPLRRPGSFIFPGQKPKRPLSDMSLTAVLRRMGRGELTAHGFRSSFRDWAAEATSYPNHVVEQALAHTIGSAVEAAYRRGDLFGKRVRLMDDWADFLAGSTDAQVLPFQAARRSA